MTKVTQNIKMSRAPKRLADKIRRRRTPTALQPIDEDLYNHFKNEYKQGDYAAIEAMTQAKKRKIHRNTISAALDTGTASPKTLRAFTAFYGKPIKVSA